MDHAILPPPLPVEFTVRTPAHLHLHPNNWASFSVADRDPACHFDADSDPACHLMQMWFWIRILPFTVIWFRIRILASKERLKTLEKYYI
jgi:hypothetical protein